MELWLEVVPEKPLSRKTRLIVCFICLVPGWKEPHMPPRGDKIEKSQLATIKLWIDQGLLPTASGKPMKKKQSGANLSLNLASMGRPTPPPLPHHLRLEPFVQTDRAFAPSAVASAPWSPLFAIASPKQVLLYHADSLDLLGILPYPEGFIESLVSAEAVNLFLPVEEKAGKAESSQHGRLKPASGFSPWATSRIRFSPQAFHRINPGCDWGHLQVG